MRSLMERRDLMEERDLPVGRHAIQPTPLPMGADAVCIRLYRRGWPTVAGELVTVFVQWSPDDGETWGDLGGFGTIGGETPNRPMSDVTLSVPEPTHPHRLIRVVMDWQAAARTRVEYEALGQEG